MLTKEDILNIDLNKINRVHFIGITAPRNAFCAEILIKMGKNRHQADNRSDTRVNRQTDGANNKTRSRHKNGTDSAKHAINKANQHAGKICGATETSIGP